MSWVRDVLIDYVKENWKETIFVIIIVAGLFLLFDSCDVVKTQKEIRISNIKSSLNNFCKTRFYDRYIEYDGIFCVDGNKTAIQIIYECFDKTCLNMTIYEVNYGDPRICKPRPSYH